MAKRDRNRLRVLRAEKRLTQLDAAGRAKMGVTRYWKIENGYIDPLPEEREKLAKALRVDVAEAFPPEAVAS
jgi:transcriptional regulator with XRE-family HTH domain